MANMSYEQLLFNAIKNGQGSKSVYDLWLELGNEGTPQDFINSLKGASATIRKGLPIYKEDWVYSDGIYKAVVLNEEITENSVVNVNFGASSINYAIDCGVLGYTSSFDGGFEIYANFLPDSTLLIDYAII